jgi:peptide/nickel transport system permease protein
MTASSSKTVSVGALAISESKLGQRMQGTRRLVRRQPTGVVAGAIFLCIALLGALSSWIIPHEETRIVARPFLTPSGEYWLGTDQLGRDMLSRILVGARISLTVGIGAVALSLLLGVPIGVLSGYVGGWLDLAVQRFVDILLTIPALVLALVLIAVLGPGITKVILAIGIVEAPRVSRVVRSNVITLRQLMFVEAAQATGCNQFRIMVRHILPNCVPTILTIGTSLIGVAIIVEAALSFLGLGVLAPTPSWGGMLSSGVQTYFVAHPWLAVPPGLAITLTVLSANLLGDAIQEETDPRLRNRK